MRLGQQLLDHTGLGAHHAGLRRGDGVRRERGDAGRQLVDERRQLVGRQDAVDPAPPLGRGGIDVVAAEDRLQRPAPPDQARQADRARAAGDDPESDLGLVEDRRRPGEAHVAAQRQLAAAAPDPTLDHGDRGLGHLAQLLAHEVVDAELGRHRLRGRRELEDRGDVEVGDEPLRVRRAEHDHADVVVDGEPVDRLRQLEVDRHRHQVDRRMVHHHRGNPLMRRDDQIPHDGNVTPNPCTDGARHTRVSGAAVRPRRSAPRRQRRRGSCHRHRPCPRAAASPPGRRSRVG